jgi:NAD(P)H-nitrite reductase large subunit
LLRLSLKFFADWVGIAPMNHAAVATDRVICHCLQVKESQIVDTIAVTGAESVRDVIQYTGAGAGCTACHCRIRELLGCRTAAPASIAAVGRA